MEPMTLFYFLLAAMAVTIAPGPDNLFVLTQGIARGRRVAIVTAWGMCSGNSVHTLAAAAGISAMFYSSTVAFQVMKLAGAAYLLFLAYKTFRAGKAVSGAAPARMDAPWASFRRGFFMNVLNPKVAIFFLAFLPQFTDPRTGSIGWQMVLLGVIFIAQALVIFTLIGYFSGSVGRYLNANPRNARYLNWLSGGIFAVLGLKLLFTRG